MPRRPQPRQPRVTCRSCARFIPDTEGISFNVVTRLFFMGRSSSPDCDPDGTRNPDTGLAKIFADRPRLCPRHIPLPAAQQP